MLRWQLSFSLWLRRLPPSRTPVSPGYGDLGWRVAVAPRLAFALPTNGLGPTVGAALGIDGFLPVLNNQLVVAVDVAYTRPGDHKRVDDSRLGGAGKYRLTIGQVKLALDAIYRLFPLGENLIPYAGAGLVVVVQSTTETGVFIPGKHTERSTNVGLEAVGGVDYRLGPGFVVGELRITYATLDQELSGGSNGGSVSVFAGYRIGLSL
jgi:hypothetical protein